MFNIYFEKDCADDKKLGRNMFQLVSRIFKEAPASMKEVGLPCANVIFDDLVHDPIKAVESVYAQFGWTVTDEYRQILKKYVDENAQKRKKSSAGGKDMGNWHTLKGFGIEEKELLEGNFAEYVKAFNIPQNGK